MGEGYEAHGRLGDAVGAMAYPGKQRDTQRVTILGESQVHIKGIRRALGCLWGIGAVRRLWNTQEAGKTQSFMRQKPQRFTAGGQVHLGQGWEHQRGLTGIQRGVGSQSSMMPDPRPVAPPLLKVLMGVPEGGRMHISI